MASVARELLLIGVTSEIGAGAVLNSPKEPSSEFSPTAPRFMSQIKTPQEENRRSQEDEISPLEKILRRVQEGKLPSDLDVLEYEVPLSPLATKFESNLGKAHPEAFKGTLKSYDRKESRYNPHPTLPDVNFSHDSEDTKSMDGRPVRPPPSLEKQTKQVKKN